MHKAAIYVKNTMKHCKAKWNEYYILKMDVSKYFDNINKKILLKILERNIKDQELMWLIKEILYANKREKGLEIGNYTSQMFANIYLNEVDQYIKHKLKVRYYCRYLDDSIVIVKTKKEAKEILEKIKKYLKENLELKLNQKTQIFPFSTLIQISDYIFYGIYTVKVLVLKRFIPSVKGKKESVKQVLVVQANILAL